MLNYIETDKGDYVSVQDVARISPRRTRTEDKKFEYHYVLHMRDGQEHITSAYNLDIRVINTQIVPAPPGGVLLNYQVSAEEIFVIRYDIVAWKIDHDEMSSAQPIVCEDITLDSDYAILQTSGDVIEPFCGCYANYDAFMDSLKEKQKQLIALKSKAVTSSS